MTNAYAVYETGQGWILTKKTRQNFKGEEDLSFKTGTRFASKELWRLWQPFGPEAPLAGAFVSHTSPQSQPLLMKKLFIEIVFAQNLSRPNA